jgi:acyl carrier protein
MKSHAASAVDAEQAVWNLIARQLGVGPDEIAPESWLADDLAVDSLELIEIALTVEEELGVTLPQSMLDEIRTCAELVDGIVTLTAERRPRPMRRPPLAWSRVTPPGGAGTCTRVDRLTPYTVETIAEDATRAGWGARLEVAVLCEKPREPTAYPSVHGVRVEVRHGGQRAEGARWCR